MPRDFEHTGYHAPVDPPFPYAGPAKPIRLNSTFSWLRTGLGMAVGSVIGIILIALL